MENQTYKTESPLFVKPKDSTLIVPKEYQKILEGVESDIEIAKLTDDFTALEKDKEGGKIYPVSEHIYKRNLSIIKKHIGAEIAEQFKTLPDKKIPIDRDVRINGLKNPLTLIIVGFASTAVYKQALRSRKIIKNIFIIEPDLQNFNEAIKRDDILEIMESDWIELLLGINEDDLLPNLFKAMTKADRFGPRASRLLNMEIIHDPFAYPRTKENPNERALKIQNIVQETAKHVQLSMGCADDSATRWKAMLRNLNNIKNAYKSKAMLGKLSDITAIVCGGGPSFEEGLKEIKEKELHKKAIIIACDAVLPKMLKAGVKPHIITRAERKFTQIFENDNFENLTKKDTEGIYYAAYPWTHEKFFDLFEKHLMIYRTNGVCLWTGLDAGNVNGGVSAANAGLELAYGLGCKNIVLTGIDLCFIGDKSHTSDTKVEFDIFKSKDKWSDIKGNSGLVKTIPVWLRCLNEYRQAIVKKDRNKVHKVYNSSINGAFISGTELKPWNELTQIFSKSMDVKEKLKSLEEKFTDEEKARTDKNIEDTIIYLKGVKSDIEEAFRGYRDSLLTVDGEATKLMKRLNNEPYWKNFFNAMQPMHTGIGKLLETSLHHLDLFRNKYFHQVQFRMIILDICQLDFFQCENMIHSTFNKTEDLFEKMSIYNTSVSNLLTVCEFYINELLRETIEAKAKFSPMTQNPILNAA